MEYDTIEILNVNFEEQDRNNLNEQVLMFRFYEFHFILFFLFFSLILSLIPPKDIFQKIYMSKLFVFIYFRLSQAKCTKNLCMIERVFKHLKFNFLRTILDCFPCTCQWLKYCLRSHQQQKILYQKQNRKKVSNFFFIILRKCIH